ncbi:hypothetical protein Tco_1548543 [Tanacetum coccineum]
MGVFGGVEKVRALGANGVVKGSTIGAVWFEVSGGMVSAKVVLMVVLGLSCECLGEFSLEDRYKGDKEEMFAGIEQTPLLLAKVAEEALEEALSLFEFQGFSSFDRQKLVHVVNGIKSVVTHEIISHSLLEDSFVGEGDHDMVHKLKVIRQGVWLFGPDILKKPSEEHGIRESHFATLSHTYHSMSDIVSKIEVFASGETIEHVAQGYIGVIFMTGEAYGIFTDDGSPLLEFIF